MKFVCKKCNATTERPGASSVPECGWCCGDMEAVDDLYMITWSFRGDQSNAIGTAKMISRFYQQTVEVENATCLWAVDPAGGVTPKIPKRPKD